MRIKVTFYSYFKDLTGCGQTTIVVPEGSTLDDLMKAMATKFPRLAAMQNSILAAVGVDYQSRNYALKAGDEVSFFPPVQGG